MEKIDIDKSITLALSRGSEKAFDTLFLAYFPKLKNFVKGFIGSEEEAENIVQDLFMNLWVKHELLSNVDNLNAYLYTIARNAVFHFLRTPLAYRYRSLEEGEDIPENGLTAEDELSFEELLSTIQHEIEKMPDQRRQIFEMSRFKGLSNEQIAQLLNISKRTVETHISIALSELRACLKLANIFF